jgi:hypothetical protein
LDFVSRDLNRDDTAWGEVQGFWGGRIIPRSPAPFERQRWELSEWCRLCLTIEVNKENGVTPHFEAASQTTNTALEIIRLWIKVTCIDKYDPLRIS